MPHRSAERWVSHQVRSFQNWLESSLRGPKVMQTNLLIGGGVSTWPIYAILDPLAPLVDSPPTGTPQLFDYAIGIVIGPIVIVLLTTSQLNGIIE